MEIIAVPPPSDWVPAPTEPEYQDVTINVGRLGREKIPVFRPSEITVRVGDRVTFEEYHAIDQHTIVQAKSADEPCTRLPNGLYIDRNPSRHAKNNKDVDNMFSVAYAWYIPYNASQSTIYFYAEGHCEQGMRASFIVDGIASKSISPEFTGITGPTSPSPVPSGTRLSKAEVAGIAVGATAAVILFLAILVRLVNRKNRAKRTEAMRQHVGSSYHDNDA